MSLNKLTSQLVAQPYLNPRVQNLRVDGILSTPSVISTGNNSGCATYAGAGYTMALASTAVCTSINGVDTGVNSGCTAAATGLAISQSTSAKFFVTANISFTAASTANFTLYIGAKGAPITSSTAVETVLTAECRSMGLSAMALVTFPGTIEMYLLSSVGQTITINSWNLTINQMPNYTPP